MRLRRTDGFVIRKSAGYIVLNKIHVNEKLFLNSTSLLIYSLTDGVRSKSEIENDAKAFLNNSAEFKSQEFEKGIEQLMNLGVIEENFKNEESLPLVTIAFKGFRKNYDEVDNYIIRGLINHFTPIFVIPHVEEPNLIVINDSDKIVGYDATTQNSISIGLVMHDEKSEYNNYDFLITTNQLEEKPNHFYIPNWALRLNLGTQFLSEELGEAMYNFLNKYYKNVNEGPYYFKNNQVNPAKISTYSKLAKGKLTIGMATYDDFDGPYFTLQSIRLHHKEIIDKLEFIIIHNNPHGPVSEALKSLQNWVPNYRYIPYEEYNGTAIRDLIFREANTEYVMSIDSHVLIDSGAISKLIYYLDEHHDSMNLFQGPMLYDDIKPNSYASSFNPEWRSGMYGTWKKDELAAEKNPEPFEIPMQGLGLFVCRKEAWLGFNPRFRGFGGEEGYIHEKFRQHGHKTICLPFLKWLHRFSRPEGIKYPNLWKDRIRNYIIGFDELGWDISSISYHFAELLGEDHYKNILSKIQLELENPFQFFDAVYVLIPENIPEKSNHIKTLIDSLGLKHIVRYYKFNKKLDHANQYDILQQELCDQCVKFGFENVFIIEDEATLTSQLEECIKDITENLNNSNWHSLEISRHELGLYTSTVYNYAYEIPMDSSKSSFMYGFNFKHTYDLSWQMKKARTARELKQNSEEIIKLSHVSEVVK